MGESKIRELLEEARDEWVKEDDDNYANKFEFEATQD